MLLAEQESATWLQKSLQHIKKSMPPASEQCVHKTGEADCYPRNVGSAGKALLEAGLLLKAVANILSVLSQRQD